VTNLLQWIRQDLKYAARTLTRSPGFSAIALATIAIGIGANAAIFSIVDAVLFRPLPYPRADELVLVSQVNRQTMQSLGDATPANFLDWRARNSVFSGMASFESASLVLTGSDRPERLDGAMVNANFFDVLDVKPAIGRAFVEADERPGAPRVAILSDGLWRRRFAARTTVVGETIRVNDETTTIVGVMAPRIDYPDKAEVWVAPHWRVPDDPLLGPTKDPSAQRTHGYIFVVARLKPGVSVRAAQADMGAVALRLEHDYPDDLQNLGVRLVPLRSDLVADVTSTVRLLFGAVAALLLIATANVSGLLIARATARRHEIALRVAIGASKGRILTQLLTESVLLAAAGGLCGVILAMWLVNPLVALSPDSLTVAGDVRIDGTVLLYSLAVSLAAGLFFGLAPARQLTRINVHDDLKQSARSGSGAGQRRIRSALVAGEIALSLVLLVAAGLTVRSFIRLQRVTTGFDTDNLVTVALSPSQTRYPTASQRADFYERTIAALREIPGGAGVAATSRLPLAPGNSTRGLNIPGVPVGTPTGANYRTASPDYFRVMGIPVLRGCVFSDADREGRGLVAVVSASLAQRFWPNQDPIGKHFSIDEPLITVVGVVGDVHAASLEAPVQPTVYVPYRQDAFPFMTFVLRVRAGSAEASPYGSGTSAGSSASLQASVRRAIWEVDKEQPVGDVLTMDQRLSDSLSRRRFGVTLLTAFGAIAAALAAIGLYGVLAFIVAQRRREIGVRMALGATAHEVVGEIMGQGLRLASLGIAIGIALAVAVTRLMESLLYGTSATDAATFAGVATLLIIIAGGASALPALRASRVDPLVALREE
jgi:putative ABC transport system permease protein